MSSSVEFRPQNIIRGVSLIIVAALSISIQDAVFKLFASQLTLWQVFALRGVLVIPLLSAYAIREPVGPLGWLGVGLGFAGVVVLLQPGTDAFSPWALLPVLGAASYALAHITTRAKCQAISVSVLSLSQNIVMLLAGAVMSALIFLLQPKGTAASAYPYIFGTWSHVGLTDWLVLTLLAGFAIVNAMLLAGAYQAAPPAIVSTFEYSYLVFVAVWDILFFGIAPTAASVSGMTLIVVAGLLVLRRKAK